MFEDAFRFCHQTAKDAGKYPHTVRIWAPPDPSQVDGFGHPSGEPTLWADDVPASVIPTSGVEESSRSRVSPQVTHRVYLDYQAGLTSAHWIEHDGRRLEIYAVLDVGELPIETELHCTEEQ